MGPDSSPVVTTRLISSVALLNRLRELPLFRGLEGTALARVSAGVSEIDARSGQEIYRRGQPGGSLYTVVYGQVKLTLETPQGGEKVVELVGPGGCFGSTSLFLDRAHALNATAIADTRLVKIAKATVLAEIDRTPAFARAVTAAVSERLRHLVGALENCMVRSGAERVVTYLLGLVPDGDGGEVRVVFPAQKGIIASQLNLTQEHFSRILRELANEGLIEVAGRNVRIPDVGQLRAR